MVQRKGVPCWKSKEHTLSDSFLMLFDDLDHPPGYSFCYLRILFCLLECFSAYYLMCVWSLQVPALEHDGKVIGESMDLLAYLDEHFDGPKLAPIVSNLHT
jgi:hypothetical protein